MLLFSLAIISTLGIYTMLPLYLIAEHSIDRNLANTLIALSRISGVIMTFIGGGLAPVFFGIIGDISSLALGIGISGGLIAAGAMFTGSLKFHDQVN